MFEEWKKMSERFSIILYALTRLKRWHPMKKTDIKVRKPTYYNRYIVRNAHLVILTFKLKNSCIVTI